MMAASRGNCPECGGAVAAIEHTPRVCVEILRWRLEESERERRVAEGTVEWLRKQAGGAEAR